MASQVLLRGVQATRGWQSLKSFQQFCNVLPSASVQKTHFHTSGLKLNENIITIQDEEDFNKRVISSVTPVIVDFHATWCGPCKLLGPRLESLVSAQKGQVLMAKVDIDDHSDLAINHGVAAVPTVVAIKGGKVVDKFVGLKDDTELESFISKLTGK